MSPGGLPPPIVDLAAVVDAPDGAEPWERVAADIGSACETAGFFYVVGHGVEADLVRELDAESRSFFALPHEEKMRVRMSLGGRAWRGYFPLGDELTSGRPDQKEGLYFGEEMSPDHPSVVAGLPLCGANLFPARPRALGPLVLEYMKEMTRLGHLMMRAIGLSLSLGPRYFERHYTREPLTLFRIFRYPSLRESLDPSLWSVGEHTDYGLLTILRQDSVGGLQIQSGGEWIEASPVEGAFICNIGDMLDSLTWGRYRSTAHRVINRSGHERVSLAFFFDPSMDSRIQPLPTEHLDPVALQRDASTRWDGRSPYRLSGTYGDYLLGKISKVFPDLSRDVSEGSKGGADSDQKQ